MCPVTWSWAALLHLQRDVGNQAVVRQLQREPNASQGPVGPKASQAMPKINAIQHEGQWIATGVEGCRDALERVSAEQGAGGARRWAQRFYNMEVLPREALYAQHGKEMVDGTASALKTAEGQFTAANDQFLMTFGMRAGNLVDELLIKSEREIKGEQGRLGLDRLSQGGEPDQGAMEKMRASAQALLTKRKAVEALGLASAKAQQEFEKLGLSGTVGLHPEQQQKAEAARAAWSDAEKEYDELARTETRQQPVLAMYTTGGDAVAKLSEILSMTQGGSRLGFFKVKVQLDEKLANIAEVREGLGGRFNPWKQQPVMDMTKKSLAATPHQVRLVEDHRKTLSAKEEDSKRMWTALAIGLGLLAAIPTGGSSLLAGAAAAGALGGAAIAAYSAYEQVQEASLQAAATGTSLDKANAISKEEPDYFWLAVDIVSAVADVVAAGAAFKAVRTVMKSVHVKDVDSLRKLATQCEAARLSPASRGRVFAAALHGGGGDLAVSLEQMLDVFRKISAPASEQKVVNYARQMAEQMITEKKMFSVRPGHEVEDATKWFMQADGLSEKTAREVAEEVVHDASGGFRDGAFFTHDGKEALFVRGAGTPESVASVFVHELTHLKQHRMGIFNKLSNFEAEVSAFASERDFLKLLPDEAAPASHKWLREASDGDIYLHVCDKYGIDPASAAQPSNTYMLLLDEIRKTKRGK